MRTRRRRSLGLTLIETSISMTIFVAVLGGAAALLDASEDLARTSNDESLAQNRLDRVLSPLADEIRRGSVATLRKPDGTPFADGESAPGFVVRPVRAWSGSVQLGDPVTVTFSGGEVVKAQSGVTITLARGVTAFGIRRDGDVYTLDITTHAGPTDDRGRDASGSLQVTARNP